MKTLSLFKTVKKFWMLLLLLVFICFQSLCAKDSQLLSKQDSIDNGEFYLTLCLFYSDDNQYDSALWYAESAIALFRGLKDTLGLIDMYHELSLINLDIGIYEEAVSYNQLALNLSEDSKDTARIIHHLKDFAVIYNHNSKFDEGIRNAKKAYFLANNFSSIKRSEMMDVLNALADSYQGKGDYDTALKYLFLAQEFSQRNNLPSSYQDSIMITRNRNSIGKAYLDQGSNQIALKWLLDANSINTKLNDDFEFSNNLNNLANAYFAMERFDSAEYYYGQAVNFANTNGSLERIGKIYLDLNTFHQHLGNFSTALVFQDQYIQIQDSISNIKKKKAFDAIEGRYQINKKQRQIEIQQTELIQQRAQIKINLLIIVGLTLAVLLISIIFIFWRYRAKQRQKEALQDQERKLKDQQTSAVIESLEKERGRIARDIHDGIGQSVSALGLNLHSLKNSYTTDGSDPKVFENSQVILDSLHDEIREIAFTLMPQKLEKSGLIDALTELAHRISESGSISVSFDAFDVKQEMSDTLVLSLFRIIQETVSNIVKYAGATKIDIQLTGHGDELIIIIEDNGTGFNFDQFRQSPGNGWNNISYRINSIGASIDFDTLEGRRGSTVTVQLFY